MADRDLYAAILALFLLVTTAFLLVAFALHRDNVRSEAPGNHHLWNCHVLA